MTHNRPKASEPEKWLPTLLSVIAGMVDLTGFLSLGIFTAHVTGNLVVIGALVVRHGHINPAQILAVPVFIFAVAATWLVARASSECGPGLLQKLLVLHFSLLALLSVFCVIARPSVDPHGLTASVAAMIAVSAMACQFALLRLTLPIAPSTAVMTGNLTNAVLSLLDSSVLTQRLLSRDSERLQDSLLLLGGFLVGCVTAAVAVKYLGDWAWLLPAVLAGLAVALKSR